MKVPIPDDWNGEDWLCAQMQWPNSRLWRAILYGFLSQATRGRFWDENTGTIIDAQATGWQIYDRNVPLIDCQGGTIPPEGEGPIIITGGGIIILEDDMGQVVTDVQIVNGKLRIFFGHCCFEDLDIPALMTAAEETSVGDDPLNPNADPGYVYSACGKAAAIVNAIYTIIEAAFTAANSGLPWRWIKIVEDAAGYDLDNNWLLTLVANVLTSVQFGEEFSDVNNLSTRMAIQADLAEWFSADAVGVETSADFEAIKGLFKSHIWPLPVWQYFDQAINALGKSDMNTIAKLGAADLASDCGQPLTIFPNWGDGLAWSHVIDFRSNTLPAGTTLLNAETVTTHTPGVGIWSTVSDTNDRSVIGVVIPVPGTPAGAITKVGLAVKTVGDDELFAGTNWIVRLDVPVAELMLCQALINAAGTAPSAPGTWQLSSICNGPYTGGGEELELSLIAGHPPQTNPPDDPSVSNVILALAIAGTGDDPFPDLP